MAYMVSQLRKQSNTTYMSDFSDRLQETEFPCPSPFLNIQDQKEDNSFKDFALIGKSSNNFNETIKIFEDGKVYYIRFKIHKIPQFFYSGSKTASRVTEYMNHADALTITLSLQNWDNRFSWADNPAQVIGSFSVPTALQGSDKEYSSYSFVFSPSKPFDSLIFRINRATYDAIETGETYTDHFQGYQGRSWLIANGQYQEVDIPASQGKYYNNNGISIDMKSTGARIIWKDENEESAEADICELINIIPEGQKWLKFGYQSRPGNLIVVNGEPITIGRSGIYEIDNGTKITSFMVASPGGSNNDKIDAFLLDYAYLTD